jgi:hypothetical protein
MSNDKPICVICQEDTQSSINPFLSPCKCKGSVSSIHRECLEQWISVSNKKNCSVCHAKYQIQMKEETVSTSQITLFLTTMFYVLGGLTMLSCVFYVAYPATYQFAPTNIFEKVSLILTTTQVHIAIHMWYGLVVILSLVIFLGLVACIISLLSGDSSGFDHSYHYSDTNGFFQMAESLFTSYPMRSAIVSAWHNHLFCAIATSGMIYLAFKFVKWYNKPVTRLRIQI